MPFYDREAQLQYKKLKFDKIEHKKITEKLNLKRSPSTTDHFKVARGQCSVVMPSEFFESELLEFEFL